MTVLGESEVNKILSLAVGGQLMARELKICFISHSGETLGLFLEHLTLLICSDGCLRVCIMNWK